MKKRAYLEWLRRQHQALKEQVENVAGAYDAEAKLKHLKREKLRIKDQINALMSELKREETAGSQGFA